MTSLAIIPQQASALAPVPQQQAVVETSSSAIAAREKASVEARFLVAYHRPRDVDHFRLRMLGAAKRPAFADQALFSKPVGGKPIVGLSIRFAEEVLRNYGNVDVQTPVVFDDESRRTIRVTVTDLEANLSYSQDVHVEKTVERKKPKQGDEVIRTRTNSYGEIVSIIRADEDALLVKQAALVSKALRTLILRLAPSDIIEEARQQVEQTIESGVSADPSAARKRMIDAFYGLGVQPADLADWLGRALDTITPAEIKTLGQVFTSIKEGHSTWAEALEARGGKPAATTDAAPVGGGTAALKAAVKRKPAAVEEEEPLPI